ncbi:hypothetical protein AXG93_225s1010 [Marchantia polymorpha subsp. ruderalis]|uniref:Aspartic peptidase DDI1-type domain-containing protein n=1 Tax=Marchantia polymorpha subsp. ruderalis TaxID=1480154 RepID=A0A176W1M0_MARPO|nr:hypothetical protein AXG93_225s1010 [Marchantia polymorpha subsp. ruderalis]
MRQPPSAQPETRTDEASVQVLRRDYVPEIKNEVSELLKEALRAQTSSEGRKTSGPPTTLATAEQRRTAAIPQRPHYDVVEDKGNQRANITCNQLLEDNKTEDLGPPEIDVEIGGCIICKKTVDSGSEVNIMTEDTTRCLGFRSFEPTTRVLRLADQTRRMPLGMLRDITTIIGGAEFQLSYIILQPLMKRGYEVLIERPWLYGARVRCDWRRKRLQFLDPRDPSSVITVPWVKIPHEGESQSTSSGYTSAKDNTSSDEESWDVRFVTCCSVEEELEDNQPDDN